MTGNPALATLAGLDALTAASTVELSENGLTSLAGLGGLTSVYRLAVEEEPHLTSLAGLSDALDVGDTLRLAELDALVHLDGLAFGRVDALYIVGNAALVDLAGVVGPGEVDYLYLTENPALADLTAFGALVTRAPSGVFLQEDDALRSLDGLDAFGELGGLQVRACRGIVTLGDLSRLTTVDGSLLLDDLDALTDLTGLENLRTSQRVLLYDNDVLVDVTALHGLTTVEELAIVDNPSLVTADAEALRDAIDEVGEVTIARNAP